MTDSDLDQLADAARDLAQDHATAQRKATASRIGSASSALLGAAAIMATVGLIRWWIYAPEVGSPNWYVNFGFIFFIILGVLARWTPVRASLLAIALYAGFLSWQAWLSLELLMTGLSFKVPVCFLLLLAAGLATRQQRR
jgi:hypothetical protein